MSDLTWVQQTITVDAISEERQAIESNDGWRLIATGIGAAGQTTLTYGWPWEAQS